MVAAVGAVKRVIEPGRRHVDMHVLSPMGT
jgi:hypothetical protein